MVLSASDWLLALRDGAVLSLLASAWLILLMRLNPRFFLRHYPQEIRAAAAPLTRRERLLGLAAGLPLFALLIGAPFWSAAMLDARRAPASFAELFATAFTVGFTFNLIDWLVLDVLLFGLVRPSWAAIPGAKDVAYRYNWGHHFRGFAIGAVLAGGLAGAIAFVLSR